MPQKSDPIFEELPKYIVQIVCPSHILYPKGGVKSSKFLSSQIALLSNLKEWGVICPYTHHPPLSQVKRLSYFFLKKDMLHIKL